jgi:small subunit ribosomal protein S6
LRRYETILIAHVDLSEDELSALITRYGGIVTGQKGILVKVERWGKRRLAYMIGKQARGFYILMDYAGATEVVNELERNLKIERPWKKRSRTPCRRTKRRRRRFLLPPNRTPPLPQQKRTQPVRQRTSRQRRKKPMRRGGKNHDHDACIQGS